MCVRCLFLGNFVFLQVRLCELCSADAPPVSCWAHIYETCVFPQSDAPQFVPGGIALIRYVFGGICFSAALAFRLKHCNKKAAQAEDEDGQLRYKFQALNLAERADKGEIAMYSNHLNP